MNSFEKTMVALDDCEEVLRVKPKGLSKKEAEFAEKLKESCEYYIATYETKIDGKI